MKFSKRFSLQERIPRWRRSGVYQMPSNDVRRGASRTPCPPDKADITETDIRGQGNFPTLKSSPVEGCRQLAVPANQSPEDCSHTDNKELRT